MRLSNQHVKEVVLSPATRSSQPSRIGRWVHSCWKCIYQLGNQQLLTNLTLTFGDHLKTSERNNLNDLISEFHDVLSTKLGKTDLIEHNIVTSTAKPIKLPQYRVPQAYQMMFMQEIKEMLSQGIIEPSVSKWASPIVPILKRDGSLRLCVDYRCLNAISQTNAYLMPRIGDLLDHLGQAHFLSTLDLTRGYWQVPMAKTSCHKTALVTTFGQFQFTLMSFWLSGESSTFQQMMDSLIKSSLPGQSYNFQ